MAATITQDLKPLYPRVLDSSGNSNHGTAYTGQALEFDGVSDHIDFPSVDVGTKFTLAAWVNYHSSALNLMSLFNTSNDSPGQYAGINGNNIAIYRGGDWLEGSTTLTHSKWYRMVWTWDGSDGSYKVYVNGVLDGSTTNTTYSSGNQFIGIGALDTDGTISRQFMGMMADVQIWDAVWTTDEVLYDYNNPESLVTSRSGTSLAYSNLKLWYPMNDSTRGTQINLMDGANTGLGSDIIEANTADLGSFDTDTTGSWSKNATLTHNASTGDATLSNLNGSGSWLILKASMLTIGRSYRATFKAKATDNTSYLSLTNGSGVKHSYGTILNPALSTVYQNYEFLFTAVHANFEISASSSSTTYTGDAPDTGDTFTFDDIVVLPVNDKSHGTSTFYGEELWANDEALLSTDYGSELVTNGDMSSATGWALDSGWAIGSGVLTGSSTTLEATQAGILVLGRTYKVVWTIASLSGGSVKVKCGTTIGTTQTGTGTFTEYITCAGNTNFLVDGHSAFSGTIDNVSVVEVGSTSELRTGSEIASGALSNAKWYEITAQDGIDFTTYGAPDNNIGTKFQVAHADGSSVPTMDSNDKAWLLDFGWIGYRGNTYSIVEEDDALRVKMTMGSVATYSEYGLYIKFQGANTEFADDLVIGRQYKFSCQLKVSSGDTVNGWLYDGVTSTNLGAYDNTTFQTITATFTAKHATNAYFQLRNLSTGDEVWISDFSIVEQGIATGWTEADAQPTIPQLGFQSYNQLGMFNGVDTSVTLGSDVTLAHDGMTFSCWLYRNEVDAHHSIFGNATNNAQGLYISSSDNCLRLKEDGSSLMTSTQALSAGEWYHIVVTHAADNDGKFYINGVKEDPSTDAIDADIILREFGTRGDNDLYLNGSLTECSAWNVSMTDAQAQELYNDGEALDATLHSSVANLSGYWRNEGAATWTDLSTNSNNGTPSGVTEYLTLPEGQNSRDTQGFLMNRERIGLNLPYVSNEEGAPRIEYGKIDALDSAATFSIDMWIRPIEITSEQYLFTHWGATHEKISMRLSTNIYLEMNNTTDHTGFVRYTTGNASIIADTWTHLVWTFNGGRTMNSAGAASAADMTKLYANGALVSTITAVSSEAFETTTASMPAAVTSIGCQRVSNTDSSVYTKSFKGDMDDVNIYSSELTANQVARNYKAGKRRHKN